MAFTARRVDFTPGISGFRREGHPLDGFRCHAPIIFDISGMPSRCLRTRLQLPWPMRQIPELQHSYHDRELTGARDDTRRDRLAFLFRLSAYVPRLPSIRKDAAYAPAAIISFSFLFSARAA